MKKRFSATLKAEIVNQYDGHVNTKWNNTGDAKGWHKPLDDGRPLWQLVVFRRATLSGCMFRWRDPYLTPATMSTQNTKDTSNGLNSPNDYDNMSPYGVANTLGTATNFLSVNSNSITHSVATSKAVSPIKTNLCQSRRS